MNLRIILGVLLLVVKHEGSLLGVSSPGVSSVTFDETINLNTLTRKIESESIDHASTLITLTNDPCSATCNPQPVITGTTDPNIALIIFANGVEIGRTASNTIGNFSFVPAAPLANGTYTVVATTIPGDCNASPGISNSIVIAIDALRRTCLSLAVRNKYCRACIIV